MRELSTAPLADLDAFRNVTDLLMHRADSDPDHAAFDVLRDGEWTTVSTREFVDAVSAVAKGLMARGVKPGDSLAVMSPTRYEWAVADLAIWFAGAVTVPIYETSSPRQIAAILDDADVRFAFSGTAETRERLSAALDDSGSDASAVISLDDGLDQLVADGFDIDDDALDERRRTATLDDIATIVYTSGTTGEPKGANLTHRNFVGQVQNISAAYREVVNEAGNTVIFLPLAHVLARGLQLICLASGMRIAHLSDPSQVVASLAQLKPTFLVVVPRVLEKIQAAAAAKAAEKKLQRVWLQAVHTAESWATYLEVGRVAPLLLRARRALFDRLFYRRLRGLMGGKLSHILSGGATLNPRLALFFHGLGLPVIEGYGLTETTAPLLGNLPHDIRSGTVGQPLPGSTVRISNDGEILARGVGVFSGYRNARHDAEAFSDGFFRTGDLGVMDAEGRVTLNGRVKDVIVTSTGKTVVPHVWERQVEQSPLVAHAVMVGESRPYLSALIVLEPGATEATASVDQISEVVSRSVIDEITPFVDEANELVSRSEQVRRFAVVTVDLDDPDLFTPTLKIKRAALTERASDVVARLYS